MSSHLPVEVSEICVLQRLVNGDAVFRVENQLVQSTEREYLFMVNG